MLKNNQKTIKNALKILYYYENNKKISQLSNALLYIV